jgi:putative redox protein
MIKSLATKTVRIPYKARRLSIFVQQAGEADKLAILLPGFLDSAEYPHLADLSSRLTGAGYIVVRFDPPGTWSNAGEISEYNITNYVEAVAAINGWAQKKFKTKKCLLAGHSFGGVAAIVAATELSDVDCVAAIMSPAYLTGALNWQADKPRESVRQDPHNLRQTRKFVVPYEFARDIAGCDVPSLAASLNCPALFIAGELDATVLPGEVEELARKAKKGKYLLLKGVQHGYWHTPKQIEVVDVTIMNYLKEISLA